MTGPLLGLPAPSRKNDMSADDDLPETLRFTSSWSLGEDGYQHLIGELRRIGARRFLEFGSGVSTVRLSRDFPHMEIVSIEAEEEFRQQTQDALAQYGGPAATSVHHRPLRWQRHGLGPFLSFVPGPLPAEVDAVLIDGPPIATRRGREACLYQSFDSLRVGGLVFLDDYRREAEKQTVRNWVRAFPRSLRQVAELPSVHRICVLEKTADARPNRSFRNLADAWYQASKHGARRLLDRAQSVSPLRPK